MTDIISENNIYHEKQRRKLCGLHTLNNLLQRPYYTSEDLNRIGFELNQFEGKWFNYCRNICWGDYDVNVLIIALQNTGIQVEWFDIRNDVKSIELDKLFGLIINYQPPVDIPKFWYKVFPPSWINPLSHLIEIKGRHWFGIRRIEGDFYNLDSKLSNPTRYKNTDELLITLKRVINEYDGKILLLYKAPSVSSDSSDYLSQ